jgi:hypothetical protein
MPEDEDEGWFREDGGRYAVLLGDGARDLLVQLCRESRALLESEDPSSDPAVARLFPPAYPDDPLRNLEFETGLGEGPRRDKLEALAIVERTAHGSHVSEDELHAWIGVVNDARLVLGTRLGITEDRNEAFPEDYADEDPRFTASQVFAFLNDLMYEMLVAVGAPGDPEMLDGSVEGD